MAEQLKQSCKIVQIRDILLVPKYLLEQVKDVNWTPEEIYGMWPSLVDDPTNLLFVVVDGEHQIKGVIWANVSLIGRFLFVNVVSLDRSLQGKGIFKNLIMPYLRELRDKLKLNQLLGISSRPKALEKCGCKVVKQVLEG